MTASASLGGRVGLVLGVANDRSIVTGCARAFRAAGADLALTYLNEKARSHAEPVAQELGTDLLLPCDIQQPGALGAVVQAVESRFERLDFALHSIAFAPRHDLQGRLVDCSLDGFSQAMDVSCHSFLRLTRLVEPLLSRQGGSLLTVSFLGSTRVVEGYQVMGPVKAALEACVRYLAAELGPSGIRVNALSPGPIATRAASGLKDFDALLESNAARSPARNPVGIDAVGGAAAFLVSDASRFVNGQILYVDGGDHVLG